MRYRATIIPLYEGHRQVNNQFFGYTSAISVSQAGHFLMGRYPYPKYIVEGIVPDPIKLKRPEQATLNAEVTNKAWEKEKAQVAGPGCICPSFGNNFHDFTTEEAQVIGDNIGVDWSKIDLDQFRQGLAVELEHGCRDPQTNITCDNLVLTGKIALIHIKEVPDYYTKLAKVEE